MRMRVLLVEDDAAIADGIARLLSNLPDRAATRIYGERYDWRETGRQHRALLAAAVAGHAANRSGEQKVTKARGML